MSVLYLYHLTVQYFPVLDPKKSYWTIRCCFSTIKAVDRKKYLNEKTRDRVGACL